MVYFIIYVHFKTLTNILESLRFYKSSFRPFYFLLYLYEVCNFYFFNGERWVLLLIIGFISFVCVLFLSFIGDNHSYTSLVLGVCEGPPPPLLPFTYVEELFVGPPKGFQYLNVILSC